jgi:hypothetical protein
VSADVIHLRRKPVDVLAIDRRHECRVQPFDDVVGDPVPLLLRLQDLPRKPGVVGPGAHHFVKQLSGAHGVLAGLGEEVEESGVARQEGEASHGRILVIEAA